MPAQGWLVKSDENKYLQGTQSISLSQSQYKKLKWLDEDEFSFGNYMIDVKEEKKEGDKIILICKVDLKEKDFLEKLIEHTKNSTTKKTSGFSFLYNNTSPSKINFIEQSKTILHKNILVCVYETQQDKSSPPPKI